MQILNPLENNLEFNACYLEEKKEKRFKTFKELIDIYDNTDFKSKVIDKKEKTPDIDTIFFDYPLTENDVIKRLGSKWKYVLKNILYLVKRFGSRKWSKAISFHISTLDNYLLQNIGSSMNISNTIKKAIDIDLLKVKCDYYYYSDYQSSNKCKVYYWNSRVAEIIKNLCSKNGIKVGKSSKSSFRISKEKIWDLKKRTTLMEKINLEKYDSKFYINQNMRFDFDDEKLVFKGLHNHYDMYEEYINMMEEYNKEEDWEINKENFLFNIKRTGEKKNITSISARASSSFCNVESEDRYTMINDEFGSCYSNDVSGSIYRITYLFNKGEWLDRNKDMYEMICGFKLNRLTRQLIKNNLAMLCYFSPSVKSAENSLLYIEGIKDIDDINKLENRNFNTFKCIYNANCQGLKDSFRFFYNNMRKVLGVSWLSEIFFHESCIYIMVKKKLTDMGFKVVRIYDGFFTDKFISEHDFDDIVKECALKYYNKNRQWLEDRRKMFEADFEKLSNKKVEELNEDELRFNEKVRNLWDNYLENKEKNEEKVYNKQQKEIDFFMNQKEILNRFSKHLIELQKKMDKIPLDDETIEFTVKNYLKDIKFKDTIHFLLKFDRKIEKKLHDKILKLDLNMSEEYFREWLKNLSKYEYIKFDEQFDENYILLTEEGEESFMEYYYDSALKLKKQGEKFLKKFQKEYDYEVEHCMDGFNWCINEMYKSCEFNQ